MPTVKQSNGCCGMYEMFNLETPSLPLLEKVIADAGKLGYGHMPRIMLFSDADEIKNGENWMEFLIAQGYKVDQFKVGKNPKTNRDLTIYHWYCQKMKTASLIREYKYEKTDRAKSRDTSGKGTGVPESTGRRVGSGFLRSRRVRSA